MSYVHNTTDEAWEGIIHPRESSGRQHIVVPAGQYLDADKYPLTAKRLRDWCEEWHKNNHKASWRCKHENTYSEALFTSVTTKCADCGKILE